MGKEWAKIISLACLGKVHDCTSLNSFRATFGFEPDERFDVDS